MLKKVYLYHMKQILGYLFGFVIFIVGIPALMWWVVGMPSLAEIPVARLCLAILISLAGLALSVWSIVYMKRVGRSIWTIKKNVRRFF